MTQMRTRSRRLLMLPAALAASLVLAACGGDDGTATTDPDDDAAEEGDDADDDADDGDAAPTDFTVGVTNAGFGIDWVDGQAELAVTLAEQRGWDAHELNADADGPTWVQQADLFLQEDIDIYLTFIPDAEVADAVADRMGEAGIPVITYDIDHSDWHFVGIDNAEAGFMGGEALGQLASDEWGCEVGLVIRAEATGIQPVNEQRVGGMLEGLRSVCDIDDGIVESVETDGLEETAQENTRNLLAANPDAENILVIGINDGSVVGALGAAEQLGRDDNIMGWGQDGNMITLPDVNPNLRGSVLYFLEGYPTYAFEAIVDKVAAGEDVPVGDTADNPSARTEVCLVTREQGAEIPGMEERLDALVDAPAGTHLNDLFCPTS